MRRAPLIVSLASRHRRRAAAARTMSACGYPAPAIALALALTREDVAKALAGAPTALVWSARERAAVRREMERAA